MPSRNRPRTAGGIAALAVIAIAAAGCSSGGSAGASPKPKALTAGQMLAAAITKTEKVNSFASQITMVTSGQASMTMSGTMTEQVHPLLLQTDLSKMETAGQNLGPVSEIYTSKGLFMKMPVLSQAMAQLTHSSKPWFQFPESALKSGVFSQLLGQLQNSNPLSATQLLAGATNTRKVGTSTINGVPVTELKGSETATAALAKAPASLRTTFGQDLEKLGIGKITFTIWVDGGNNVRKEDATESGSTSIEMRALVTSVNQPVTITPPSSGQVIQIPASALSGSGL